MLVRVEDLTSNPVLLGFRDQTKRRWPEKTKKEQLVLSDEPGECVLRSKGKKVAGVHPCFPQSLITWSQVRFVQLGPPN